MTDLFRSKTKISFESPVNVDKPTETRKALKYLGLWEIYI